MTKRIGVGSVSLVDLNDAIVSGVKPSNPSPGAIWIDESVNPNMMKKWDGTNWIELGELDPDLSVTIESITKTLGNMSNDNMIDFQERQVIKDKLNEITGTVISNTATTLPTSTTLDNSKVGNYAQVRASALKAGLDSSNQSYINVETKYNQLRTYLNGLTPKVWDLRESNKDLITNVIKDDFRNAWLQYYISTESLIEATMEQLKKNVDDIEVVGRNILGNSKKPELSTNNSSTHPYNRTEYEDYWRYEPLDNSGLSTYSTLNNSTYPIYNREWLGKDMVVSMSIRVSKDVKLRLRFSDWGRLPTTIIKEEYFDVKANDGWTRINMQIPSDLINRNPDAEAIRFLLYTADNGDTTITPYDGYIDSKEWKIAFGNKPTDWTEAPEDNQRQIDDILGKIINVESRITDEAIINKVTSSEKYVSDIGNLRGAIDDIDVGGKNLINDSDKIYTTTSASVNIDFHGSKLSDYLDSYVTVSFDARKVSGTGDKVDGYLRHETGVVSGSNSGVITLTTDWKRYHYSFKVTQTMIDTTLTYCFRANGSAGTNNIIADFTKIQIEKGNKATDWALSTYDFYNRISVGGTNLITLSSVSKSSGVSISGFNYRIEKTASDGNQYIRIPHTLFEGNTEYVITFKAKKISGNIYRLAGHSTLTEHSTVQVFMDGKEWTNLGTGWSSVGDNTYPNDTNTHQFEIRFKTVSDPSTVSTPYWYIQPNRPQYEADSFVIDIWDWQLEKGNKSTSWRPSIEDTNGYADSTAKESQANAEANLSTHLQFDGIDDYVMTEFVPNSTTLGQKFTWEFSKRYDNLANNVGSSGSSNTTVRMYTQLRDTSGGISLGIGDTLWGISNVVKQSVWHHFSVVFDSGTVNTYLNGNLIDTKTGVTFSGSSATPYMIGRAVSNSRYLEGASKEHRFWNIARTEADIKKTAGKSLTGDEVGLVAYWRLDDGFGETVTDIISNTSADIFGAQWRGGSQTVVEVLYSKINSVEQNITADGIFTEIIETEDWQNIIGGFANVDMLGDFATLDELDELSGDVDTRISGAIQEIDFEPYATKLQLEETSRNITAKFSATGGMNLVKNSIGFAGLDFWNQIYSNTDTITISNLELDTLGFGSGFDFPASSNKGIYQDVPVVVGQPYTLSWYLNKRTSGDSTYRFYIQIQEHNGTSWVTKYSHSDNSSKVTDGYVHEYVTHTPETDTIRVRLIAYANCEASITGIMLSIGDIPLQWSLATGEVYNTNIRMDINGVRVSQLDEDRVEIGYTHITPEEFAGYFDSDGSGNFEKVFYLNGEETVTKKVRAEEEITMGDVKIIRIASANNSGWAFVPVIDTRDNSNNDGDDDSDSEGEGADGDTQTEIDV